LKINKKAWKEFEDYDLDAIQQAVEHWDDFCGKLGDLQKIRKNLLILEKKATTLQDEFSRTIPDEEESIGDLAGEIEWAVDDLIEDLEKVRDAVEPLSNFVPDPDEEVDEDDED